MSKKRISDRAIKALAASRMERLTKMAYDEARSGELLRSRRYNELARRIAMRCNVSMRYGTTICPNCLVSLVPGHTGRVRLNDSRISVSCMRCGYVRRMPYIREKKKGKRCHEQGKM